MIASHFSISNLLFGLTKRFPTCHSFSSCFSSCSCVRCKMRIFCLFAFAVAPVDMTGPRTISHQYLIYLKDWRVRHYYKHVYHENVRRMFNVFILCMPFGWVSLDRFLSVLSLALARLSRLPPAARRPSPISLSFCPALIAYSGTDDNTLDSTRFIWARSAE